MANKKKLKNIKSKKKIKGGAKVAIKIDRTTSKAGLIKGKVGFEPVSF